jgi:3-deoxy-D-manno-octulosonic-acid transferase
MSALALYRGITKIASPVAWLLLRRRLARGKEDGARIMERQGAASVPRPDGPLAWLHAASVGEAQSALVLIARLIEENPALTVLVTTGTVTSAQHMKERLPARAFHQFLPLDCPQWVARFLDHWRPDFAIWMESELWPNLVSETAARGIPAFLVNARMSSASFQAWCRLDGMARRLLSGFALCLAQTEDQAERLRQLGARNVSCLGNLKYSAAPLAHDPAELDALQAEIGTRPVWVAASTHDGEELMASNAHIALLADIPELLTVIVPRHPNRAAQIHTLLSQRGHRCARRSTGDAITRGTGIYIADTLGELGLFYRLARIAFIGGSMGGHGGHNPLEAAQLDCAVLHGPDMANFQSVSDSLLVVDGAEIVTSAPELAAAVRALLEDRNLLTQRIAAAADVAETNRGVIERVYEALRPEIEKALAGAASGNADARA